MIATARFAEPVHGYFGPTMSYAITEFSDVNGHAGPGFMLENTAVHPVVTATSLPGFGAEHERVMQALPYLARAVVVLRDQTQGRVAIDAEGRARYEHALGPPTWSACAARCASSRAPTSPPMRSRCCCPCTGSRRSGARAISPGSTRAPLDPTRFSFLYAVHLFGGASMGGSRASSACRPDGELWDVRGLYVTDASGLPGNTGVNPQVTISANALRIASALAERGPRA